MPDENNSVRSGSVRTQELYLSTSGFGSTIIGDKNCTINKNNSIQKVSTYFVVNIKPCEDKDSLAPSHSDDTGVFREIEVKKKNNWVLFQKKSMKKKSKDGIVISEKPMIQLAEIDPNLVYYECVVLSKFNPSLAFESRFSTKDLIDVHREMKKENQNRVPKLKTRILEDRVEAKSVKAMKMVERYLQLSINTIDLQEKLLYDLMQIPPKIQALTSELDFDSLWNDIEIQLDSIQKIDAAPAQDLDFSRQKIQRGSEQK